MKDNVIISAHALQRMAERLDMKKTSLEASKILESRRLEFNKLLSTPYRAIYDHINDNGFITRYIFNHDSTALLTVITKGQKDRLKVTDRELKRKSIVLSYNELKDILKEIVPEATDAQADKLLELFYNQRSAVTHTYVSSLENRQK